ncbi:ATP-dependent DNA helicase RecG [Arcanobacterium wilhelmae]|uniref:ATP-dependent DNA helicase RecG n=1 Tax=Arcanobacterium wilhelmae TaxID=1803177 RepID=A0ABT9NBF8_9ACTO|nr:ATP-binding protein [Arcanobacterium wilhelmae]MDP9801050.1 ATP-dependent DNA helicase RecG [Arcanobacterium wilhelmae]WFN90407.1 ATP-binding protein [Arcanobacterium wilhelmae]
MAPRTIEAVLELAITERTQMLLTKKEDQWFDRKSIKIAPKKLAETLVALANAEGGKIVVGMSGGKVEPTEQFPELENKLRRTLTGDYLEMPFPGSVSDLEVLTENGTIGHILVFDVAPSERVARTSDGRVYMRMGDSNITQGPAEVRELEYSRGRPFFEAEPCDLTLADLDVELLTRFSEALAASRGFEHLLKSRYMLTTSGQLTNAAALLFSLDPVRVIPGSEIRVVRYNGKERLTGERQNITFDRRTSLPIPKAIDQALEWITEQIPTRKALIGHTFTQVPLAPQAAWTEGVVNAAIHRSYSFMGDSIRVEIFDDRLQITNPGMFRHHSEQFPNPLKISRFASNPIIARTCTDLGYSQELGEGIKRMVDEMRSAGLTDPVFEQQRMHVILTLPFLARVTSEGDAPLPKHADSVIRALRSLGGRGGTTEIASAAGLSRPTTRTTLQALESAGIISWDGKSPTDPRAFWLLTLH